MPFFLRTSVRSNVPVSRLSPSLSMISNMNLGNITEYDHITASYGLSRSRRVTVQDPVPWTSPFIQSLMLDAGWRGWSEFSVTPCCLNVRSCVPRNHGASERSCKLRCTASHVARSLMSTPTLIVADSPSLQHRRNFGLSEMMEDGLKSCPINHL